MAKSLRQGVKITQFLTEFDNRLFHQQNCKEPGHQCGQLTSSLERSISAVSTAACLFNADSPPSNLTVPALYNHYLYNHTSFYMKWSVHSSVTPTASLEWAAQVLPCSGLRTWTFSLTDKIDERVHFPTKKKQKTSKSELPLWDLRFRRLQLFGWHGFRKDQALIWTLNLSQRDAKNFNFCQPSEIWRLIISRRKMTWLDQPDSLTSFYLKRCFPSG